MLLNAYTAYASPNYQTIASDVHQQEISASNHLSYTAFVLVTIENFIVNVSSLHCLEIVEDGDLEVRLLAFWHLTLSVHIPRGSHDRGQVRSSSQDLIMHSHAAAPATKAP